MSYALYQAGASLPDYSQLLGGNIPQSTMDMYSGVSALNAPLDLGLGGGASAMASLGAPGAGMEGMAGGGAAGINPVSAAISGIQTVANIWNSFQAQKMAKKQFKFTKQMTRANLANQVKSYNTALADRARSRGFVEGQTQDQIDAYVRDNSLHTSANGHRTTGSTASLGGASGSLIDRYSSLAGAAAAARSSGGSRSDDEDTPSSGG